MCDYYDEWFMDDTSMSFDEFSDMMHKEFMKELQKEEYDEWLFQKEKSNRVLEGLQCRDLSELHCELYWYLQDYDERLRQNKIYARVLKGIQYYHGLDDLHYELFCFFDKSSNESQEEYDKNNINYKLFCLFGGSQK